MRFFNLIVTVLTVAILLTFTSDADAFFRRRIFGRCGGGIVCAPPVCVAPIVHAAPICTTVCAPIVNVPIVHEVITPVAVPIFVPTFQFQYAPPCASYPVAAATGFGYPAYGTAAYGGQAGASYGAAVQQTGMVQQGAYGAAPNQPSAVSEKDKIRQLAKALLEEMNKESGTGADQQDDGPPVAILSGQSVFQPQPQITPPEMDIVAVLRNRCGVCHTGPAAKGRFMIFDQFGQLNYQVDRGAMLKAVNELRMPEGAMTNPSKRLTQAEYNRLSRWVTTGS